MKPRPVIASPATIIRRDPIRSMSQPMMGPSGAPSRRDSEKTPAVAARDQPNSSRMGLKKTPNP